MGSRYGVKIRKREREVVAQQNQLYVCSACGKRRVGRTGYSLWRCNSCGSRFAGGAYSFETSVGVSSRKSLFSLKPHK
ncbi:MAG: 50S ribosomal protein L37ae [Candidatus Micrarchaeota archaeon]